MKLIKYKAMGLIRGMFEKGVYKDNKKIIANNIYVFYTELNNGYKILGIKCCDNTYKEILRVKETEGYYEISFLKDFSKAKDILYLCAKDLNESYEFTILNILFYCSNRETCNGCKLRELEKCPCPTLLNACYFSPEELLSAENLIK